MTITQFTSGINTNFSTELNNNFSTSLRQAGKNLIRQAQDRAVDIEASGGEFVEAYTDSTGWFDNVNSPDGNTTAVFDTDKYKASGDDAGTNADYDPDSITNYSNIFDSDDATYANKSSDSAEVRAGKEFTRSYFSGSVTARVYINNVLTTNSRIFLDIFDGTNWSAVATLISQNGSGTTGPTTVNTTINSPCVGVRLRGNLDGTSKNTEFRFYSLDYTLTPTTDNFVTVSHTIPSGRFSSTIASSFATVLHEDWEADSNVQYKLTGSSGAEDTGWLEPDTVSEFTAFTAEPDTLIVKLIPKTTSPTSGTPSIKGVAVFE